MSRQARIVAPGVPHHVTQRGNYRQKVFPTAASCRRYLQLLRDASERCGVMVWAYCLMPNHVHLVLVPSTATALGQAMDHISGQHARGIHEHEGVVGHLWQARYYSCVLDGAHLVAAVRYVERNPVRAGLIASAWEYPWSSARERIGRARAPLLDPGCPLDEDLVDWRAFLESAEDTATDRIRLATLRGQAAADDRFVHDLEAKLGRRLRPRPVGRPRRGAESPRGS